MLSLEMENYGIMVVFSVPRKKGSKLWIWRELSVHALGRNMMLEALHGHIIYTKVYARTT
jgi:hypothetical protein